MTVEEWVKVIGDADVTNCSVSYAAATVILSRMQGYGSKKFKQDERELANALIAYARLLHEAGVTP